MRLSIVLISLLFPLTTHASIYKWVDANGQTHFSEEPTHNDAKQVFVNPHKPNNEDISHTRDRMKNIQQWVSSRQKSRHIENMNIAKHERRLAVTQEQCHGLKNQLKDMDQGHVRWYKLNQQGERNYLSENDIINKKQGLRSNISKNCSDTKGG